MTRVHLFLRRRPFGGLLGLCALGVLLGLAVPGRRKRAAAWAAALVFAATYVPLMAKFLPYLLKKPASEGEI